MTLLRIDSSIQGPASSSAALADLVLEEFRTARPDEQVVTRHLGAVAGFDPPRQLWWLGAITATDHTHTQAAAPTVFDQPQDQRRLAGAAHGNITDHHHRHRRLVNITLTRQEPCALALHHPAIQGLQRPQ